MAIKETAKSLFAVAEGHRIAGRTALYEAVVKRAESLLSSEMKIKELKFLDKHEGSDWWETCKLMYPIAEKDGMFVITSEAAEWKETKTWEYSHRYEAFEQVEKLMLYKNQDRKAGYGDREADIERAILKHAARQQNRPQA